MNPETPSTTTGTLATGTLQVLADSPTVVCEIRDWELKAVAQGMAPWTSNLPAGLYSVTARYAGRPSMRRHAEVRAGERTIIRFSNERSQERRLSPLLSKTPLLPNSLATLLASKVEPRERVLTPAAAPTEPQKSVYAKNAPIVPPIIGVRFFHVDNSGAVKRAALAWAELESNAPGKATLIVHSTRETPLWMQIAQRGAAPLNIAVPGQVLHVNKARVTLHWTSSRFKASVEFANVWASAAAEFVQTGHFKEAKELMTARTTEIRAANAIVRNLLIRFRDITGLLYFPYLMLRYAAPEHGKPVLPAWWLESFGHLPDAGILAAEFEARAGNHVNALEYLLALPAGGMPLFTDGFSILLSRLRSYGNPNAEVRPEGIDDSRSKHAEERANMLLRWAPFVDQNALTLTFTGVNPLQPGSQVIEEAMDSKEWTVLSTEAVDENTVISREREQVQARREHYELSPESYVPADKDHKTDGGNAYFGLALSGGGIRSATLNLGILQGLSSGRLLHRIDYLSTVSGGGYIGTWLHGVIRGLGNGQIDDRDDNDTVKRLLSRPERGQHENASKDPIEFLRKYSSYLAPTVGLFSADFWVIMVIWFRNMMLNQYMIIPMLATMTLAAMTFGSGRASLAQNGGFGLFALVIGGAALLVASSLAGYGAGRVQREHDTVQSRSWIDSNWGGFTCAALAAISAICLAHSSSFIVSLGQRWWVTAAGLSIILFVFFFVLQWCGSFVACYKAQHPRHPGLGRLFLILFPLGAGAFTGALLAVIVFWIDSWQHAAAGTWHVVAWGTPLLILVWLTGTAVHIGLMGRDFPDSAREWLARTGAYLVIIGFFWAALFALTIFGPYWISKFALSYGKTTVTAVGGWLASTIAGVLAGKSSKSSGDPNAKGNSAVMEWILKVAPAVFMTGFLLLISLAVYAGLRAVSGIRCNGACAPGAATTANAQKLSFELSSAGGGNGTLRLNYERQADTPAWLNWLTPLVNDYWCVLGSVPNPPEKMPGCKLQTAWRWTGLGLVLALVIVALLGSRIDINEFSMNHLYKNRLVRCYLGASRSSLRRPSPFTGFDSCDDFPLASLLPLPPALPPDDGCPKQAGGQNSYFGPYPILNGAVNLFRGSDLARQERKAESFIFTPLYCGFTPPGSNEDERQVQRKKLSPNGYSPTINFGYPHKGPDIGTCMAISGAAANPNWGYHTSAPVALLLTLFDVRLGWWVGNPRRAKDSSKAGPNFAPAPLFSELFAQTDPRTHFLNISDGGHFENLGLYELVRRGCRFIVVGDGEQDNELNFESLGGAIRKCRADFSADIKIDPRPIKLKDGYSTTHCVVGTIKYLNPPDGFLLYLKASLTNDEPEDIAQYQSTHKDFPHQTTANQFFTESQFESYRKLGLHICKSAFDGIDTNKSIADIFKELQQKWYQAPEIPEGAASRHAEAYSALMKRLAQHPELRILDEQVFPKGEPETAPALPVDEIGREAYFFCVELIQLMENVWLDLRMDDESGLHNPKHQGWVQIFRYWARQPTFSSTWMRARHSFNPVFQKFFDNVASQKN